jgi:class 3 adenylate cyclase
MTWDKKAEGRIEGARSTPQATACSHSSTARLKHSTVRLRCDVRLLPTASHCVLASTLAKWSSPRGARGIAVHEVARIAASAERGEILVSETTRVLATGAGLSLDDRGEHELKGLEGSRRLFALAERSRLPPP